MNCTTILHAVVGHQLHGQSNQWQAVGKAKAVCAGDL